MSDAATPNLPSRDFEITSRFFSALGFTETWRDRGRMILKRHSLTLEFSRILTLIRWQAGLVVAFGWTTWMPSTRFAKKPEFPKGAKGNRGFTLLRPNHGADGWGLSWTRMALWCG